MPLLPGLLRETNCGPGPPCPYTFSASISRPDLYPDEQRWCLAYSKVLAGELREVIGGPAANSFSSNEPMGLSRPKIGVWAAEILND